MDFRHRIRKMETFSDYHSNKKISNMGFIATATPAIVRIIQLNQFSI